MRKKLLKITGIFVGLFFILTSASIILFRIYSPNYFIPYVIEQVQKETNGRYTLAINSDSVKANILTMNLNLGHTEFKRDTSINDNSGIEILDKFDIRAQFESLKVSALQLIKFVFNRKIRIEELVIDKPSIVVRENIDYRSSENISANKDRSINNTPDTVPVDTLVRDKFRSLLKVVMPPVRIDKYQIKQASFALYGSRKTTPIQEVHGMDLSLVGFISDENVALGYESITVQIDSASALVSQFLAQMKVEGLHLHTDSVHIDHLQLGHYVNPYKINKIRGFRSAWLNIDATDIDVNGIYVGKLLSDSILNINKTSIGFAKMNFFKDKEEQIIDTTYQPSISEIIRKFPFRVLVDTFEIRSGDLVVDMESPKAIKPGRLNINNLKVQILNITNMPTELQHSPNMKFQVLGKIEDSIKVDLKADFEIPSPEDKVHVTCDVKPFHLSICNDFIGSQFFVEFPTGMVNYCYFEFDGTNKAHVGTMDLEYDNLKIRKLQNYQQYIEGKPKTGFATGIGNMLIPTNRSRQSKRYKQAIIYYEREYHRDFIYGTLMSLASGIASSVGFGSKNLEKKEGQADKLDDSDATKSKEKAQRKTGKAEKKKKN